MAVRVVVGKRKLSWVEKRNLALARIAKTIGSSKAGDRRGPLSGQRAFGLCATAI